jgi:hypothetical protein
MANPKFMFHVLCPQGQAFDGDDPSFPELESQGWVDDPSKLTRELADQEQARQHGKEQAATKLEMVDR